MYNALLQLKQTGTRGLDELDGKIIKMSAHVITETVNYIYNLCIDKNCFPKAFKQAKVIPIYKSGDNKDPSNYRPISILSVLSKRKATLDSQSTELRRCVKVDVAFLDSPSLIVLMVSVDVKQH